MNKSGKTRNPSDEATPSPESRTAIPAAESLVESRINLISPGTHLEGKLRFDRTTRISGRVSGSIQGGRDAAIILSEEGLVEGNITADRVYIEGFVEGDIEATEFIHVASGGRVVGNLTSPRVQLDFGAWFEGECRSGKGLQADSGASKP